MDIYDVFAKQWRTSRDTAKARILGANYASDPEQDLTEAGISILRALVQAGSQRIAAKERIDRA